MASADFSLRLTTSPFQAQGEISPGKNATLHHTTAGSTSLRLDSESFAVICPLALLRTASYPVPVRRPMASLHASSPRSVTLPQLRFASIVRVYSREDFHLQGGARAGRTNRKGPGDQKVAEAVSAVSCSGGVPAARSSNNAATVS